MAAKSESCEAFRSNVSRIISERDITIAQIARDLKMSRPGFYRILSGDEGITLDRAEKIAIYLGKTLPDMLRRKKIRISA